MTWKDAPVADVLKTLLECVHNGHVSVRKLELDKSCAVFSYREDFAYLWDLEKLCNHLGQETHHLVVVWDGMPENAETINVADHVTALDWVVALFLSLAKQEELPPVRLHIYDLASQNHPGSFACKVLPHLLVRLPQVRLYHPVSRIDRRSSVDLIDELLLNGRDAEALDSDLHELEVKDVAGLLRDLWTANLTKAESRHTVSNLVAPLVLEAGLRGFNNSRQLREQIREKNQLRMALAQLLEAIEILDPTQPNMLPDENRKPIIKEDLVQHDLFAQFNRLRFLLVDDQADLGYDDILRFVIFGSPHAAEDQKILTVHRKPDLLIRWLYEACGMREDSEEQIEIDWSQPRVLGRYLPDVSYEQGSLEKFDILFLDLRLFQSEPDEEAPALQRLIDFYFRSQAQKNDWPQLQQAYTAAIARVTQVRPDKKETSTYEHLSLLPLLLSYVDPSLPIVIFSSSRQRSLMDAFSGRANIITSFSKPIVSGYTETSDASRYIKELREAILEALRLHEARSIWERLVNAEWKIHPAVSVYVGKGTFEIFNVPEDLGEKVLEEVNLPGSKRIGNAHLPLGLTPEDFRAVWAMYFKKYIQVGNFNDLAPRPWEYFEGHFTPADVIDNPKIENSSFKVVDHPLNDPFWLHHVLSQIRHKKAHGGLLFPNNPESKNRYRIASILLIHLFLDWVTCVQDYGGKRTLDLPNKNLAWTYLRDNVLNLPAHNFPDPRKPNSMATIKEIDGFDYLVYATLFYWDKFCRSGTGSRITADILARISKTFWKSNNWTAQCIGTGNITTNEEHDEHDQQESDNGVTRYVLSLGRADSDSLSSADDIVKKSLDPSPKSVSVDNSKGLYFVYVTFDNAQDARSAFRKCNGQIVLGGKAHTMHPVNP